MRQSGVVADLPTGGPASTTSTLRRVKARTARRVRSAPVPPSAWFVRIAIVVVLLGGWQLLGSSSSAWKLVMSTPWAVLEWLWEAFVTDGAWWSSLATTLQEALLGFALGVSSAVVLVAVIVPVPLLARFVAPFVAAANALPIVVMAPMFIVWFGISLVSKVYFVAIAIFFIIFYGLYTGIRSIDSVLVDNARMLGASPLQLVRQVYLPAVLTWIIAGLRLSATWALLAAVVAEYLGSNQGIGYEVAKAQQQLEVEQVIAGILVIAIIAVALDRILVRIETRFSQWRVF